MTSDGIDAGGMLTLINDEHSIELIRQTSSDYGIVYGDKLDCTEDSFPFGEIFDFIVEGSELPAAYPRVQAVWMLSSSARICNTPTAAMN